MIMENNKLDNMADSVIWGMIAVYQSWFNSDRSLSIEETSQTVSTLNVLGITEVVGKL